MVDMIGMFVLTKMGKLLSIQRNCWINESRFQKTNQRKR